jgi:hypothetical protein
MYADPHLACERLKADLELISGPRHSVFLKNLIFKKLILFTTTSTVKYTNCTCTYFLTKVSKNKIPILMCHIYTRIQLKQIHAEPDPQLWKIYLSE